MTGVMRFQAWRGLSDEYRARTEGHSPWARGRRRSLAGADLGRRLLPASSTVFEAGRWRGRHHRACIRPARARRAAGRQVHALPRQAARMGRARGPALPHDREPHRLGDRPHARAHRAARVARAARDDHAHRRRGHHRAVDSTAGSSTRTTPPRARSDSSRPPSCSRATAPRRSRGSRCSTRTARRSLPADLPGRRALRGRVVGASSCAIAFARPARSAGRSCARTRCTARTATVVLAVSVIHDVTRDARAARGAPALPRRAAARC